MAEKIKIPIDVDTGKAIKEIERFSSESSKSLQSVANNFSSLKTLAIGAVAVLGSRDIVNSISGFIDAAKVQEDAVNKLNSALKISVSFSAAASKDLQKFASSLQNVTKIGDETTLEMLALAKTFGVTNEGAKELVKAAADYASGAGVSFESAVRTLGGTLQGIPGELAKNVQGMKNLTIEQLKAGDAIKLAGKQFKGFAESESQTFSGAVQQAKNAFGDLQEELGFFITKSPQVISAVKSVTNGIVGMIEFLQNNGSKIESFVEKLANVGSVAADVAELLAGGIFGFGDTKELEGLTEQQLKIFKELSAEEKKTFLELNAIGKNNVALTKQQQKIFDELNDSQKKQFAGLQSATAQIGIAAKIASDLAEVEVKLVPPSTKDFIAIGENGPEIGFDPKIDKQIFNEEIERITQGGAEFKPLIDMGVKSQDIVEKLLAGFSDFAIAGADVVTAALKIPAAIDGVSDFFDQLTDLPTKIVSSFARLDKSLDRFLKDFPSALIGNLPSIVESIVTAIREQIPALIEALTDPEFLQALTEALIEASIEIGAALAIKGPEIGFNIIKGMLTGGLERIGLGIANGVVNGIESSLDFYPPPWLEKLNSVFDKTPGWIKKLEDILNKGIPSPGDIAGKGQGLIPDKVPVLGKFASGGVIPGGFPNDTFVAGLTSGERVLNNDEVANLNALQGQLNILTQLVQQPIRVATTAQVNGQAFADIFLELNRNNARISA